MSNYVRPHQYRNRRRQKENAGPIRNPHNVGSIISDKAALKIHGLNYENNGYSSDSDSGKSEFDEEYFKNKPQPLPINRWKVVTIKRLNTRNEQPQIKKSNLLNVEINKDFSSLKSGKSGTNSTSSKNEFISAEATTYKNIEPVKPYIHPNLNKFSENLPNDDRNIRPIQISSTAQTLTENKMRTSLSANNYEELYKNQFCKMPRTSSETTSTNNFSNIKDVTYQPTVNNSTLKSSVAAGIREPAFQSPHLQKQKVSYDHRNRSMQTAPTTQTTRANDQNNQFNKVTTSAGTTKMLTTFTPTHNPRISSAVSNYHSLALNVSNLPDVLTKVPDPVTRSTRNALLSNNVRDPAPPHNVINASRPQNVNSPNRNISRSPHRDIFAGESINTIEENAAIGESSEAAGLCGETSGSFCGRCIDFILCRKC